MKKLFMFLTIIVLTLAVSAQSGQILKKDFNLIKGSPNFRLIGTTPSISLQGTNGVITFNSGDVTLTNTSNTLTLAGGVLALPSVPTIAGEAMGAIQTKTYTIGAIGVAACDSNWTTAANTTQQIIKLTGIVPALSRILDVFVQTDVTWAGTAISAFTVEGGNASSGAQFFADTDIITAAAIGQTAVGAGFTWVAITAAAVDVYISGAPTGGNWAALLAGKLTVYITYIEY